MSKFLMSLCCFLAESFPTKRRVEKKIAYSKSAEQMAFFLIGENASLATLYSDFCTACMIYTTVPSTVARA